MSVKFLFKDLNAAKAEGHVAVVSIATKGDVTGFEKAQLLLKDAKANEVVVSKLYAGCDVLGAVYVNPGSCTQDYHHVGGELAKAFSKVKELNVVLQDGFCRHSTREILLALALRSWGFDKYMSDKSGFSKLETVNVFTAHGGAFAEDFAEYAALIEGMELSKNLISEPGNVLYPATYVSELEKLREVGVEVEVLDEAQLKKLGLNMLLAVCEGSVRDPYVVVMKYKGTDANNYPLALVGKGVTFDTGGISIKPSAGMEDMKYDMGGSAVVAGLMKTLALSKAKINVIAAVGLVENMPSGSATRPGDVVVAYNKKTVEIANTDAEGRLVLGDVLAYVQDIAKPEILINFATLTGAIIISLGHERSGIFSNDAQLAQDLVQRGEEVGDLAWYLPIGDEYKYMLKSQIADIRNISSVRPAGGSITAAMFLKEFINDGVKWAHVDIAGTAWTHRGETLCNVGAKAGSLRMTHAYIKELIKE